jgi:hypothetical protein
MLALAAAVRGLPPDVAAAPRRSVRTFAERNGAPGLVALCAPVPAR